MIKKYTIQINEINKEISDLDSRIGTSTSDRELNKIGAGIIELEKRLNPLLEALALAQSIPEKFKALKKKARL